MTALPPGPRMSRALQTVGWGFRPYQFMENAQRRYGDMFTATIAQEGIWVFLCHPDQVKQVFTGDPRLLHAGEGNVVLLPLVGSHSVLLLDDAEHMRQRKLMLPPFHGERMQGYQATMAEVTEREVARWPKDTAFPLQPRMQAVTLEIIMRVVFGFREGARLDELRATLRETLELAMSARSALMIATLGPRRFARLPAVRKQLAPMDGMLVDEIRRRRGEVDLEERDDILSMLVQARHEDGSAMSDEELRDELVTLLVAGHETTATALSWAVERLVRHPEALERVREGDEEYVDAVVKETLRLRPVLPLVVRKLTEPMEIGGCELPAGVSVTPCIHLVHRRPDIYPEPRRFRPERFLEQPAGTYTWIPFGGGVRRCLGASFALFEMKTVLTTMLSRVELRAAQGQAERVTRRAITLTPERGAEVVAA